MADEAGDQDQRELLRLLEDGLGAAAVAEHLGCTLGQLSERLVALRARLGVASTAAAVHAAKARGLL